MVIPDETTSGGNLSNQNQSGQVVGESNKNKFPWDWLIIILGLLGSGILVLVFILLNFPQSVELALILYPSAFILYNLLLCLPT